jgi:hypothetical protein
VDFYAVIGTVLALLGLNALWNVPRQVRLHNRQIEYRNENQAQWIEDVDRDLSKQMTHLTGKHIGGNNEWPRYLRIWEKQKAKDEVIKRLTDQQRDSKQYRDEIELSEGWEHTLWRRLAGKPLPELTVGGDKAAIIEKWNTAVTGEDVDKAESRRKAIRKVAGKQTTPTGPFPRWTPPSA